MKHTHPIICGILLVSAMMARAVVPISPAEEIAGASVLAKLRNEHVEVSFVEAKRGELASARPVVRVRQGDAWIDAPLDASAESYQVVFAPETVNLVIPTRGFYPRWPDTTKKNSQGPRVIWDAGENHEAIVSSVDQLSPQQLKLRFHPLPVGTLEALWSLAPGEKSVTVSLAFTPTQKGQFSLGYFLFNHKPLDQVDELLMPMLVNAKRFPAEEYTLLETQAPTPMSLMQVGPLSWAVSGDPGAAPFEFPVPAKSRYGLHIRNPQGQVQPSIYGPLVGTPESRAEPGQAVKFDFRVLVQPGDWYAGYRTIADEVFAWSDYRKNDRASLTEAALNMIDLYMDDEHGGWWDRAKAPYQVESKNGSTQSSPLTALSLYRLTGDRDLYRRRSLPTLEFILSRDGPHFSPIPENTGGYAKGSMNGPVDIFGATVYAGMWEMMNRRTPVLEDIAFPAGGIRSSGTQQNFESHNQPFDEWLGRYLFTGDKAALDRAVREADEYIAKEIATRSTRELGVLPFFLMPYVPAWEGLLRLYEVTKEKRFLDASAFGARMVMTGMWTQPTPAAGDVLIHPDDYCHGDKLHLLLHKGETEFRLGWPRKAGDTPERKAPGWLVSNVGLGFEQPTTYTYQDNGGRMILQAPWTSSFLRLATYTGDPQFGTYARNAVVGRWSNYPGYYYTTFTDLMRNPRYPYEGPDVSFVYYHHIPVHLSWTIDYLVSEAGLRSQGKINFPALRQFGYAYFDNLVYGHLPGEVMGEKDMWLWFDRDLLTLDNPQINHLTAQNGKTLAVILTNANREPEKLTFTLKPDKLNPKSGSITQARFLAGGEGNLDLTNYSAELVIPPLGQVVLAVDGLDIEVPSQRQWPKPELSAHPGQISVPVVEGREIQAAAIQLEPGSWDAYVWTNAESQELREITLSWKAGDQSGTLTDKDYPYEFSVPVPAGETAFRFTVRGIDSDGTEHAIEEQTIGVSP
jgi:hypothetical protein